MSRKRAKVTAQVSWAQLVEHRTGIAEVTGSNPVEALIFFSGFFYSFQLLKLENLLRDDHSLLS